MLPLLDQSTEQLRAWFAAQAMPAYRAAQVRHWLFERRAAAFDQMTDLPKAARERLAEEFQIWTARIAAHRTADDGTEKLLLDLADGQRIECVLLRDDREHCAICISTQVGCAMRCAFCASGLDGVVRNLTTGEILEQMLQLQRLLAAERAAQPHRGDGHGRAAAQSGSAAAGLGRSRALRRPGHQRPAHHGLDGGAAAGHSPAGRGKRPVSSGRLAARPQRRPAERNCADQRNIGIAAVMAAADEYFEKTGRRVTFEYVLLAGVNDRPEHARELAALLKGRPSLVNLIPFNPVEGLSFDAFARPSPSFLRNR